MRKNCLIIILYISIIFPLFLFSQNSFEFEYGGAGTKNMVYTFEDNDGNYISIGANNNNDTPGLHVLKLNPYGEIMALKIIQKPDSSCSFDFGYQKSNGNYFFIGTQSDSLQIYDLEQIYFCEMTKDLDIVWQKSYLIPDPYINIQLLEFVFDKYSNLIIEGRVDSVYGSTNDLLCILKADQMGNVLSFNLYNDWHDLGDYDVFMHNFDSTGFILLGEFAHFSFLKEWIELDTAFNIQSSIAIIDPQHYISPPVSTRWLPNGNMIVANRESSDLYVKIMDQDRNTLNDTLLVYPESAYVGVNYGIDYTDENNVYIGTFTGVPPGWTPGSEIFRIHIFDQNGHLKGMKEYGDDVRYWFYNLKATSDGGCIMTGMKDEYYGSLDRSGYLIKVMPDDIVTHAGGIPFGFDNDVSVYPNPFIDMLTFENLRKNLKFSLFDNKGQEVINGNLNKQTNIFTTRNLNPGFFFYTITDKGRIVQSGKLIKE